MLYRRLSCGCQVDSNNHAVFVCSAHREVDDLEE